MALEPVVLDTDTLSELSRGNAIVKARAVAYLAEFGRLTITAGTSDLSQKAKSNQSPSALQVIGSSPTCLGGAAEADRRLQYLA